MSIDAGLTKGRFQEDTLVKAMVLAGVEAGAPRAASFIDLMKSAEYRTITSTDGSAHIVQCERPDGTTVLFIDRPYFDTPIVVSSRRSPSHTVAEERHYGC